jgi:N-acetylmuramoyl-L-alanine amidase
MLALFRKQRDARVRVLSALLATIAQTILLLAVASPASASTGLAVLASAKVEPFGNALELHFSFRGTAPRWKLRAQDNQLTIDLPRTSTALPPRPLFGKEVPPIKSVRVTSIGGRSQIAIEVAGKADYAVARLNHEIVLRIAAAGTVRNIAAPILVRAPPHPHLPLPNEVETVREERPPKKVAAALARPAPPVSTLPATPASVAHPQLALATDSDQAIIGHPLVIIDPGHGGYDPGTSSASGIHEKDLALDIALKLQRALQARGMRTEMTRSTDVFIPLSERTKIANRAAADLFVSIHLNSSPNPLTSGIEVYYLNNTTDRATIRLARMENAGAPVAYGTGSGPNLHYILTDLRQQFKANEAASLARMIDAQAVASLDSGMGTNVNALGAKMGPFYVLVGANMPAVLVETGFLSNSREAQLLASPQYQDLLADGIATAIAHYFNADVAVGNL